MDHASLPLDSLHALELRVLEGPQAGARAPLAAGRACVLAAEAPGEGKGADIVLREDRVAPARLRITAERSQALLEVLHGEVRLAEQVLSPGAQATWAWQTPLRIGSSVVAFGLACVDDWSSAARLSGASPEIEPQTEVVGASADAATPLRRRAEAWLAATGAMVLLACAGSLWMAHVIAAPRDVSAVDAVSLAAALKTSEFVALEAVPRVDGRLALRGRLDTIAQRARLDAWLLSHQFTPAVDVQVDESVTHEVTEVFRVNGVPVRAWSAGPGQIVAEAAERDADRLARAEGVVRRDVRGLDKLSVQNTPLPAPPGPPLAQDPAKRIASIVSGDMAYVVTADGARYFVGALLPSGHRITQVVEQRVTLERDGQQSTLNF